MRTVFLDIETIPTQDPEHTVWVLEHNKKKARPATDDKAYRSTSLSGSFGEVVCIGWAIDDEPRQVLYRDSLDIQAERALLVEFAERLKPQLATHTGPVRRDADSGAPKVVTGYNPQKKYQPRLWVGHNVQDFDLRMLFQRCLIHQFESGIDFALDRKDLIYDTSTRWSGSSYTKDKVSLGELCQALRIPCKSKGMDGSMVWDAVVEGRIREVAEYCGEDVDSVRDAYKRLTMVSPIVGLSDAYQGSIHSLDAPTSAPTENTSTSPFDIPIF